MDSSSKPSTVRLKVMREGRYEEARVATAALTPGMLARLNSSDQLVAHATAGGYGETLIITEDLNLLKGKTIDDDYAVGDLASYVVLVPGDLVYTYLADGENVVVGDQAISDGAGAFKKTTGTPVKIFGVFTEALDLSGAGNTTKQRIRMRAS